MIRYFLIILLIFAAELEALTVGVGQTDITPPIGTPSAGYMVAERKMTGIHDPLLATALVMDTGEQKIAICAVDHLGFDHTMVQEIKAHFPKMDILVASSHTHSGAGAYLNTPVIGEKLAGQFDPSIRQFLIDQTVKAIEEAIVCPQEARIGIGYGTAPGLNIFRSSWPSYAKAPSGLSVIQFFSQEGQVLATIFNYAMHPTVLSAKNTLFSADFIGYARSKIENELGGKALFINGAQGDVGPNNNLGFDEEFQKCQVLGEGLAERVIDLAHTIAPRESSKVDFIHYPYAFKIEPTTQGLRLPVEDYQTELNLLVFDKQDFFVTIPGELSSLYLKDLTRSKNVSVFGLVNDAHGYILKPEAFEHKTPESRLSFGGPYYGERVLRIIMDRLFVLGSY